MDDATRKCPYCAEEVPAAAVRCRYCRSRLTALDPADWYRDRPERRLAGVSVAVARAFALPVGVVRVAFIAFTFFHLLGPIVYAALWIVIPYPRGEASPFERAVGWVQALLGQPGGTRSARPGPGDAGGPVPGAPDA